MLCLLCSSQVQGQSNDVEAGLANIGLGAVVGGLGAIINKKPEEKTGKVFLKGLYQGAFGGYLVFESKRLIGKFAETENYAFVWPSKLINSAGTSIIENAALNTNFWEVWHLNIGFNRLQFYTKDKFKVDYRIMPFSLGAAVYGFTQGNLDFRTSLKTGNFVFINNRMTTNRDGFVIDGMTAANVIFYRIEETSMLSKNQIVAHEIIHVYQYESLSGVNTFLDKPTKKFNSNYKWLNSYHKIFYTDFNFLLDGTLAVINPNFETNFLEREARYFVNNRVMD
ncbi:hypothetical protein [Paucihalobacter sp.]